MSYLLKAGLWIRIDLMRIRMDPAFFVFADPDVENIQPTNFCISFPAVWNRRRRQRHRQLPSVSDLRNNKNARIVKISVVSGIQYPNPDPLVRGMNLRIRIRN